MFWPVGWFPELFRRALGLFEPESVVRSRERKVIHAISLATAFVGFYLISSSFFPQFNPLNTVRYVRGANDYHFYSTAGGLYEQLGEYLESSSRGISITNDSTPNGSKEIARDVAGDDIGIGVLQSDVLRREAYSENSIEAIATVYQEKVHVFYSEDRLARIVAELGNASRLMIKPEPSFTTRMYFKDSRVRMQSSTQAPYTSLAGNILDICGLFEFAEPRAMGFTDAMDSLVAGSLDVVFWTGGAPNIYARDLLDKNPGKIGMMSIHPSVREGLARIYDRPMVQSNFRPQTADQKMYSGSSGVTTLATDALLVSNPNVPRWVIRDVADRLTRFTPTGGTAADSPLYGRDFAERIMNRYPSKNIALLQTALILILFLYLAGSSISSLLLWLVSSKKESKYLQDITDIYTIALPMHTELEMQSCALNVPVVEYGAKNSVNKAVNGIASLTRLIAVMRDDAVTGGLTINHQRHIMETAYNVRAILRSQLAKGLERAGREGCDLSLRELRNYFYSGYISRGAYHDLVAVMNSIRPPGTQSVPTREAEASGGA